MSSYKRHQQLKAKYPDAVLFIETQTTLETFGADAIKAAQVLQMPLTLAAKGEPETLILPGMYLDRLLSKMVAKAHRVAIATYLPTPPAR